MAVIYRRWYRILKPCAGIMNKLCYISDLSSWHFFIDFIMKCITVFVKESLSIKWNLATLKWVVWTQLLDFYAISISRVVLKNPICIKCNLHCVNIVQKVIINAFNGVFMKAYGMQVFIHVLYRGVFFTELNCE